MKSLGDPCQRPITKTTLMTDTSRLIFISSFLLVISLKTYASLNPDAARTNATLGLAFLKKGFYAQSKSALLEALREDPKIASPWYSMGYYFEKTKQFALAENYYHQAIKVNPHSGSARNNYGIFLCHQQRYAQALAEFKLAENEPTYLNSAKAAGNAAACLKLRRHEHKSTILVANEPAR